MAELNTEIAAVRAVTNASLAPNIVVVVGTNVVGYIQQLVEAQSRPANPTYEVGSMGIVELIPGQPAPVTLNITKLAVYGQNLIQAFMQYTNADETVATPEVVSSGGGLASVSSSSVRAWANAYVQGKSLTNISAIQVLSDAPVGIVIKVEEHAPDGLGLMTTTYHDCFFTTYGKTVAASGNLTITETATLTCRWVEYGVSGTSAKP